MNRWFATTIFSMIGCLIALLALPVITATTDNALTETYISKLERAGYYCIPASASAGNLYTNNILPFADSTYSIGASGNEYLAGYFDNMYVKGDNITRSATFVVGPTGSQADYITDGTDDQVQIQAAIDALPATGGTVVVLDGSYSISAVIEVDSYTTLDLTGANITMANSSDDVAIINANHATSDTDIHIIGGIINGNNANQTEATLVAAYPAWATNDGIGAITLVNVARFSIRNTMVVNGIMSGIELIGCSNGLVEFCDISESMDDNLAINRDCSRITAANNNIYNSAHNQVKSGGSGTSDIEVQGARDITISGNHIYRTFAPVAAEGIRRGIFVTEHSGSSDTTDVVIKGNTITSPGGPNSSDLYIAINVYAPSNQITDDVIIDSNTISINGSGTAYCYGIGLERAGAVKITNNTIDHSSQGIRFLTGASGNISITGNTIRNSGGIASTYGLRSNVGLTNVLINKNDIYEQTYVGMRFETGATPAVNVRFTDNSIIATSSSIYFLSGMTATNVVVMNNYLSTTMTNVPAAAIVRNNQVGWITEASGTGSVASGTTTDVITHGLSITPTLAKIRIVGLEDPTNSTGNVWITSANSTSFTVNVENDPGASNWDFGWSYAD